MPLQEISIHDFGMRSCSINILPLIVTAAAVLILSSCGGKEAEAVDLGLSVKWASWNLGARSQTGSGDYYSWGEVSTKETYDWTTYSLCEGTSDSMLKYCVDEAFGTLDGKSRLEPADDAARAAWGNGWSIPTIAQWKELKKECKWTWTTVHGVKGYLVTGTKRGFTENSIFLPLAGNREFDVIADKGKYGHYWSSDVNTDYTYDARSIRLQSGGVNTDYFYRYYGFCIRPVTKK